MTTISNQSGQTGLIVAVKRGRAEIVEALLACPKIDVNIQENVSNFLFSDVFL